MKLNGKAKAAIAGIVLAAGLSGGGLAYAGVSGSSTTVLTPVPGNPAPAHVIPATPVAIGTVPSGSYTGTTSAK